MGRGGLEPPTSRLSGVRSNHLSYRPARRLRLSPERSPPAGRMRAAAPRTKNGPWGAQRVHVVVNTLLFSILLKRYEDGPACGLMTQPCQVVLRDFVTDIRR